MSQLVVYKASAGSGKTFRLAAEYIKQLIANPENYKRILAVTFTNKATAEMKSRILNELFAISNGENTPMGSTIANEADIEQDKLQARAKRALSLILHDYSAFSVNTIDSFVQRVIQALLWEIGQQGGVDIELDTAPVLEHAADNLLDSASKLDELLGWLTSMGHSLLDEGKSWDVRRKLTELGGQLFSEKFRLMSREDVQKFTDRERVTKLKESLQKLLKDITQEITQPAKDSLGKLDTKGIDQNHFSYGNAGVIGFFQKCDSFEPSSDELPKIGARVKAALNDSSGEKWVTKAVYNNQSVFPPIGAAINEFLHPTLTKLVNAIEQRKPYFASAKIILKNLENLALIGDLWNKVRELSREEGFLLLSDSGHLLREFVKEADAPFVYEKIGTRYDIFMIDEFQDTSEVQWHNFKPLIDNSLSQGHFSMIVGDVKQSIYRWRNGDWTILASGVGHDFQHHGVDERLLDTNRRSLPAIVEFNNQFFNEAKNLASQLFANSKTGELPTGNEEMHEAIVNAYKDVKQIPVEGKESAGYVETRFVEYSKMDECDGVIAKELPLLISQLKNVHSLGDIAILVRSKNDGQKIAGMLLEHNRTEPNPQNHITFVSQEGLQLKTSAVVRVVISALRLVQDPNHEIARRVLAKELINLNNPDNKEWHECFTSHSHEKDIEWLSALNTRPLQEVFEAVAQRYKLFAVTGELAHLGELHEHISTLSSKGGSDVNRFLEWWEQNADRLSLSVPESTNAVSILTIHKSKGLQFPVVIIPYASWRFRTQGKSPLLWVTASEEPFNILPKYPIHATTLAEESLFAREIFEEKIMEIVDNLNMLYVAFTRPEKELYVFIPITKNEKEKDSLNVTSKLIWDIVPKINLKDLPCENGTESERYCFGKPCTTKQTKAKRADEESTWIIDSYPVGNKLSGIRLKMEAEEFFSQSEPTQRKPLERGKILHALFANIQTLNDTDTAIKRLVAEGLVVREKAHELNQWVKETLSTEPAKNWFSGSWEVKNEASILTPSGSSYRPDRVMVKDNETIVVDFKFGEELPQYQKQLGKYANLLHQMGYPAISSYIWYVDKGKITKV